MQKTKITAALLFFVSVAVTIVHIRSLDGLQGHLLALVRNSDTAYAAGYTDERFRKIQPGQSEEEVITLVGRPFADESTQFRGTERWMYSRSPNSRDYRYREIQLVNGVVTRKIHHYYVD